MGKKHFLFLLNRRDREPNPELWRERQRANHYPRAPARIRGYGNIITMWHCNTISYPDCIIVYHIIKMAYPKIKMYVCGVKGHIWTL